MVSGTGRVSSYAIHQSSLRDAARTQTDLYHLQNQLSSGLKAEDFQGMASQAEQFLDLENKIAKTSMYMDNNKIVETRLNVTDGALGRIIDIATDLKNTIMLRRNGTAGAGQAFAEQLRGKWQALTDQLNTNLDGRYLFSGSKTNVAAVDITAYPTLATAPAPDDGYYNGSKEDVFVRAQDGVDFSYNVRADAPGFQKIFAGLAMAKTGDTEGSTLKLGQAFDLVEQGVKDVIGIQATVNTNKVNIDQINERHQNLQLYWKGVKEEIGNTDIVSASTQVAINQGILQAAYQAFAKINSLRLSDYLR